MRMASDTGAAMECEVFAPGTAPGSCAALKLNYQPAFRVFFLFVPSHDIRDRYMDNTTCEVVHTLRAVYTGALARFTVTPPKGFGGGKVNIKISYTADDWLWVETRFGKDAPVKRRLAQLEGR